MKRILVTGAAGFVGRHALSAIARARAPHDQIIGIGRRSPSILPSGVDFQTIDLLDSDKLSNFIEWYRPTDILHLAAVSSVQQSANAPTETWKANLVGLLNIAECVSRHLDFATFLFVSSGEVYGRAFLAGHPLTEEVVPQPNSSYASSKWFGEQILRDVLPDNICLLILRPFNHVGIGQDERFVIPSFAGQIARMEKGLVPPILNVGNISTRRDFLPVGDVVDAYVNILFQSHTLPNRTVLNVSSGIPRSIESILITLNELSKLKFEIQIAPDRIRPTEITTASGDASFIESLVGWKPRLSWNKTISDVLAEARIRVESSEK